MPSKKTKEIYKNISENSDIHIEMIKKYNKTPSRSNCYEFLFISRGDTLNFVNGKEQLLKPRTLLIVRPDEKYILKSVSNENVSSKKDVECFKISVGCELMEHELSLCSDLYDLVKKGSMPYAVKLSGNEASDIQSTVKRIIDIPKTEKRDYLYNKLFQRLCALLLDGNRLDALTEDHWFAILLSKIENSPVEALDYTLLYENSSVSKKALWQNFKKHFNMTPVEYFRNKKCDAAYKLVCETDMPFNDIAKKLNYGCYSQFFRDFVEVFGKSPREAREKN